MSDWIDALRTACGASTQAKVARQIGYSGAAVSQVLSGKYTGNLAAVEQAVRGALMDVSVVCPILGSIAANVCSNQQKQVFAATNPQRVALFRACRGGCPHYKREG